MPRPRPSARSLTLAAGGLAAVALAAAAAPRLADGAPRKGKVVRVERSRAGGKGVMRMCVHAQTQHRMVACYGRPPARGEIGTLVDEGGERATVRVTNVESQRDSQGNEIQWNVTFEPERGDLSQVYSGVVLFDWPHQPGARLVSYANPPPTGRHYEHYLGGIDQDNDGVPETIMTWYACDATGASTSTAFGTGGYYCLSYFVRNLSTYDEVRRDIVAWCNC